MDNLNTFPVSFKVEGRRLVIVGGGDEALNKARLAAKTSAEIIVVAREFTADFGDLPLRLVARGFVASDLDGAALVFVADDGADGEAALAAARGAGVPVNVVDQPEKCDFFVPSIVAHAPVSVAIATEGDAPVLARLLRAKIEAAISPELGRLARLAGSLRGDVARRLTKLSARRFYEDLIAGVGAPEDLLRAHEAGATGLVWLIGAGPGATDLLTLRAQRLLQAADVVVHDQLVPEAVIEMGRRDATRLSVGKRKGHHSFTQAQINALLVRLAKQGLRVARLKSGDPMVFGRAGEEIAALKKAGISYEIVPGITAALAAAADSATPVTLRQVSSGLVFATAHGAKGTELDHWAALAAAGLTLALYMGKSVAGGTAQKLIRRGLAPELPVGIVVNAGRPDRVFARARLGEVAAGGLDLAEGPAIIFIGKAVASGDWAEAVVAAETNFKVA